jgi:fatty acid desaturase
MQDFVPDSIENIANIGKKERRKRLALGIAALAVGVVAAVLIIQSGLSMWWRLALFVPFFVGFLGYFQEMGKT